MDIVSFRISSVFHNRMNLGCGSQFRISLLLSILPTVTCENYQISTTTPPPPIPFSPFRVTLPPSRRAGSRSRVLVVGMRVGRGLDGAFER